MHISLAAEPLFHLWGFPVTNSLLASGIGTLILSGGSYAVYKNLKKMPTKAQNMVEMVIDYLDNLADSIGGAKTRVFLPLVMTIFLYVLISNWLGLVPGFGSVGINKIEEGHSVFVPLLRGGTADLNTTLALGLIAVVSVQYYGFKAHKFSYFKKFIDFSSPIMFVVGILEIVSEFAKIASFSFRLFGNVFAGEVLLAVVASLVPVLVPFPFFGLEIFVGLIQALVFAMLTMVFINSAMTGHGEEVDHG